MPFKKLLSSILLRSVGIIFRYSSSVTIVESMRIVSMIYDRLLTATGELPALRRAFERSLLSCVMSSVVSEASILEMASIVCYICSLTILSLSTIFAALPDPLDSFYTSGLLEFAFASSSSSWNEASFSVYTYAFI